MIALFVVGEPPRVWIQGQIWVLLLAGYRTETRFPQSEVVTRFHSLIPAVAMHCYDLDPKLCQAGHSILESLALQNTSYIHRLISDCMIELVESMPEAASDLLSSTWIRKKRACEHLTRTAASLRPQQRQRWMSRLQQIITTEHVIGHQVSMIELLHHLWTVDAAPFMTYKDNARVLARWSTTAAPPASAALRQVNVGLCPRPSPVQSAPNEAD